ncbi:hypothetical protein PC110_g8520 [Phytophthora cactorum]|uniref:Uncharacterized protein n=1 Tax=Phytophthora cactorum TaxID=29920 RepID=A0A329SE96_9STRA|nr:hypothetical protein PC110_g8520 [Phytophthora cactorum]
MFPCLTTTTTLSSTPLASMVSSQERLLGFSIMPSNPKKKMCKVYKVIVLGDSGVGKSSLVRRMTNSDSLSTNTGIHKTTCREWRSWKVPLHR